MTIEIRLLGAPRIDLDGHLVNLRTRKALGLLAFLAVEQQLHARDRLMDLFWPESDETLARASLRNALAHIRTGLDVYAANSLITQENLITFQLPPGGFLDTQILDSAEEAARKASRNSSTDQADLIPQLQMTVSVYQGDFISGLSLLNCPDFELWASLEREHRHQQLSAVLSRLFELQMWAAENGAATETALRWLSHDPLSDAAARSLMRAQARNGDRHSALRTYQRFRSHLERELKCEPEPETQAIAEEIRRDLPGGESQKLPNAPLPPAVLDLPFVGRALEFNRLVSAYYATIRAGARCAAIIGEAGIGKTRLIDEFLQWVKTQDADILTGRAWEGGGHMSYQPIVDAFRVRLEKESELTGLLDRVWLAELSRLLPEIRERYTDLPQPNRDEGTARQTLFEALTRLGRILSQRRGIVWVLEDVHWSDIASFDLLGYVLRSWSRQSAPVFLIITARSEAMEDLPNFTNWLYGLSRDVPSVQIELGYLTPKDIQELTKQIISPGAGFAQADSIPEQVGQWLWTETVGNPLLLTETVDALREHNIPLGEVIYRYKFDADLWKDRSPDLLSTDQPERGIHRIVRWRMNRLSPAGGETARAAAVLGSQFSLTTLAQMAELDDPSALSILEELIRVRLLQPAESEDPYDELLYAFTHQKVQAIVLQSIHPARKVLLHRRAFSVLENQGAPAAELAYHALEAHQIEAAFRYSSKAGDAALEVFAAKDAIYYYEKARQLLEQRVGPAPLKTTVPVASIERLYVNLSKAYEIDTEWDRARITFHTLIDMARETQQTLLEWTALNRLAILAAQHSFDVPEAMRLVEQALEVAEGFGDKHIIAETEWNLTQMANFAWQPEMAIRHGHRAVQLSRELGMTELTARALYALGDAYCFAGRWEDCVSNLEESKGLYDQLRRQPGSFHAFAAEYIWAGLPPSDELHLQAMQASCMWQLAEAYVHIGRLREGIQTAREALTMGLSMNNPWTQVMGSLILSNALMEGGYYEEAYRVGQEAVALARRIPNPSLLFFIASVFGAICQSLQLLDAARKSLLEALSIVSALPTPSYRSFVISKLCANASLRGNWQEAYDYAQQSISNRRSTPAALIVMDVSRSFEIEALIRNGDVETAQAEVNIFGEKVGNNRRYRVAYLRCSAVLSEGLGRQDQAIRDLEEAAEIAESIGLRGELWQIYAALGELYRTSAIRDKAQENFTKASRKIDEIAETIIRQDLRDQFLSSPLILRARGTISPF